MSVTTEQREQGVGNAVREISHIATLPEITLKIVELVEDRLPLGVRGLAVVQ